MKNFALQMLHDILEPMVVRYGIHKKEESIPILIKARKLMREQGLEKWEAVDKVIEEIKQEKKKLNFFRPGGGGGSDSGIGSDSTPTRQIDITVTGTIKYKKHLVDKDTGLDTVTVDMPLRYAKVYFRGYYKGERAQYYGPCLTNNNGQFTYTIGGVYTPFYCMPLVFLRGPSIPSGPSGFNRVKVISDTIKFSFIPPPEDSQTWRYRWDNVAIYSSYYDFGTKYCAEHWSDGGLWPDNHQPRSGAANIYDQLLKGYEYLVNNNYTSPDSIYKVVARWQQGCTLATYHRRCDWPEPDTIFIAGDTTGQKRSYYTDEWDDLFVLHEYGHHVMHRCAVIPPETTKVHYWYKSYTTTDTFVGYAEGWPSMFAGVVTGNNYMVDTRGMIGALNDTTGYYNIENPWDFRVIPPFPNPADSFEGGPYCEGAVCGALWDIYDSYNEIPYPSYPDSLYGVWFPDTGLADSLSMGFDEIWDVFDHYDPAGEPTNCWTIFHFRSGWNAFNYNHQFALNQILLHHRIQDSIPAKPTGLSASQQGNGVRLYWRKNSESDLQGYRIYRRSKPESTIPPSPWGSWGLLVDKTNPNDTTHLDQTVQSRYRYRYRVTAYDSVGNESDYSDSVEIYVAPGTNPDDIGTLALKSSTIMKKDDILKICFNSLDDRKVVIKLYDVCGRLVQRENFVTKKIGENDFTFKLDWLPAGIYFVRLEAEDYNKFEKIVIVR
jgi:hypothetical protein